MSVFWGGGKKMARLAQNLWGFEYKIKTWDYCVKLNMLGNLL